MIMCPIPLLKPQRISEQNQKWELPQAVHSLGKETDANNHVTEGRKENLAGLRGRVLGRGGSSEEETLRTNQKNNQDLRGEEERRDYCRRREKHVQRP